MNKQHFDMDLEVWWVGKNQRFEDGNHKGKHHSIVVEAAYMEKTKRDFC